MSTTYITRTGNHTGIKFGPGKSKHAPIVAQIVEDLVGRSWRCVPLACGKCAEAFRSPGCVRNACGVCRVAPRA